MTPPKNLTEIIQLFTDIFLKIVPFLGALAFLIFIYGVARFIKSSSEKEIKDSKNILIWGVIGIFIMVSIWGIIAFLKSEFGFGNNAIVPQIYLK